MVRGRQEAESERKTQGLRSPRMVSLRVGWGVDIVVSGGGSGRLVC